MDFALRVGRELADPVGPLEVEQHQDVEEFGAGSGAERVQAFLQPALELVWTHGLGAYRGMESFPFPVSRLVPHGRRSGGRSVGH